MCPLFQFKEEKMMNTFNIYSGSKATQHFFRLHQNRLYIALLNASCVLTRSGNLAPLTRVLRGPNLEGCLHLGSGTWAPALYFLSKTVIGAHILLLSQNVYAHTHPCVFE